MTNGKKLRYRQAHSVKARKVLFLEAPFCRPLLPAGPGTFWIITQSSRDKLFLNLSQSSHGGGCSLNLSRSVTFRKFPEDYSVLKKPSPRPLPTALYELSSTAFAANLDDKRLELHCHCLFLPSGATRLTVPQVLPTLAYSDLFTTTNLKPSPKLNCHLSCPRHFPLFFLLLTMVKATAVCPRPLFGVKWH